MSEESKHHITPYRVHFLVFAILLVFTAITIAITKIELGVLTVTTVLLIACIKGAFILIYFMHLKFDDKLFRIMVGVVFIVFFLVVLLTFSDYANR